MNENRIVLKLKMTVTTNSLFIRLWLRSDNNPCIQFCVDAVKGYWPQHETMLTTLGSRFKLIISNGRLTSYDIQFEWTGSYLLDGHELNVFVPNHLLDLGIKKGTWFVSLTPDPGINDQEKGKEIDVYA